MFIVFSGPSGCGKNTVMAELKKLRPNLKHLEYASATTRPERETDKKDKDYVFMSKEQFKQAIADGKLYEYAEYNGNYYGTLLEKLEAAANSDLDYMKDVEVNGHAKLRDFFSDKCKMVSIFLDVPNDVLRDRLRKRGESEENINKRLSRGEMERSRKGEYDFVIENIDLNETINKINDFLNNATK